MKEFDKIVGFYIHIVHTVKLFRKGSRNLSKGALVYVHDYNLLSTLQINIKKSIYIISQNGAILKSFQKSAHQAFSS